MTRPYACIVVDQTGRDKGEHNGMRIGSRTVDAVNDANWPGTDWFEARYRQEILYDQVSNLVWPILELGLGFGDLSIQKLVVRY